jgi:hypothetical protein
MQTKDVIKCKTKNLMNFYFKEHFPKNLLFYIRRKEKILNYTVKKLIICPAALAGSDRYSSTRCPHRKAEKSFLMQMKDVIKCKTKNLMHFNFKEKYQEMLYQAQGKNAELHCKKTSYLCSYPGRIRSL